MALRFLNHTEIDKAKWDFTIDHSKSALFYAQSWYLDVVSPDWCAIVDDDYVSVMPLPLKRKWGLTLVTQPLLCQQLGIFSSLQTSEQTVLAFLHFIPKRFPLVRLSFNAANILPTQIRKTVRSNYVLNLSKPYNTLFDSYSDDTKRNLKKASKKNLTIVDTVSFNDAFSFFTDCASVFNDDALKSILTFLVSTKRCSVYGIYFESRVVSISFFVNDSRSVVCIASATNALGRKLSANYAIIDWVIQKYANKNLVIDFEGSSIPSIAKYFEGFGAQKTEYWNVRFWTVLYINKLDNFLF